MTKQEALTPCNFEERVIWHTMTWTYGLYTIGGLYIAAPVIAWMLLCYLCKKLWMQNPQTPVAERITIPWGVWVWVIAMLMMLLGLVMGHLDFNLAGLKAGHC